MLKCLLALSACPSSRCCTLQGIDLEAGGRNKKTKRTAPKSDNVYLKLLVKVISGPGSAWEVKLLSRAMT